MDERIIEISYNEAIQDNIAINFINVDTDKRTYLNRELKKVDNRLSIRTKKRKIVR